jgi:hypothetical protein
MLFLEDLNIVLDEGELVGFRKFSFWFFITHTVLLVGR